MEHNEELTETLAHARYLLTANQDAWEEEEEHAREWHRNRARKWLDFVDQAGYTIRKKAQPRKTRGKRK